MSAEGNELGCSLTEKLLSEQFPHFSISTFKSSSTQLDVHSVNYGHIESERDHETGGALGQGYTLIDKSISEFA